MSDQTPDLVTRLRAQGRWVVTKRVPLIPQLDEEELIPQLDEEEWRTDPLSAEAADEIERLRAEIEDMKNALWKACGDDEDAVAECLGGVS